MLKGFFNVPKAVNEPVKSYAPGSPERAAVVATYTKMWNSQVEVPLYIGSEEIKTSDTKKMSAPHDHQHIVGVYHQADRALVEKAITSARKFIICQLFINGTGARLELGSIP